LGVRFVNGNYIREEYIGFVPVVQRDFGKCHCQRMHKLRSRHGQTIRPRLRWLLRDGYSSQNGVQARIREKCPKAAFVHCASHRLNLVVNDLNDVSDIRNAVAVMKKIVNFFP